MVALQLLVVCVVGIAFIHVTIAHVEDTTLLLGLLWNGSTAKKAGQIRRTGMSVQAAIVEGSQEGENGVYRVLVPVMESLKSCRLAVELLVLIFQRRDHLRNDTLLAFQIL